MNRTTLILVALVATLALAGCRSAPTPEGPNGPDAGASWSWNVINVYPGSGCDSPPVVVRREAAPTSPQAAPRTSRAPQAVPCPPRPPAPPSAALGDVEWPPQHGGLLGDPMPGQCKDGVCTIPEGDPDGGAAPVAFTGSCMSPGASAYALLGTIPGGAWALLGAALSLVALGIVSWRKRRVWPAVAPLLLLLVMLPGCARWSLPASQEDLSDLRQDMLDAAGAQEEAYTQALAGGASPEEATAAAFGANVQYQRDEAAKEPEPASIDWMQVLAGVLGGGVTGTGLVRLLRGSPLKSGSGNGKGGTKAKA